MLSRRAAALGVAFVLVAAAAFALGALWSGRAAPPHAGTRASAERAPEIRLDPDSVSLLPDARLELRLDAGVAPPEVPVTKPRGSASGPRP